MTARRTCALALALTLGLGLAQPAMAQQAPAWLGAAEAAEARGDLPAVLAIIEAAARAGDPTAQAELGVRYVIGVGVSQDFTEGAQWLRQAADAGDARAQNTLARLIFENLVAPTRSGEALALFEAAAQTGDGAYLHDYGAALEATGALDQAIAMYEAASAAGHAEAFTNLGVLYLQGQGVEADLNRAQDLFEAAAALNDARGQNNLGLMYARGQGVERDYDRAAELFQAAADQGLGQALSNLGVLYENGFGVELDEAEAYRLYREGGQAGREGFRALLQQAETLWSDRLIAPSDTPEAVARDSLAAQAGDPVALYAMGYRFNVGVGRAVDRARAASFYRRSAEAGFAPAALSLGVLYARGLGVPQDFVEAYRWLNVAATSGEPESAALRDAILEQMSEGQRDRVISE